MILKLKKLIWIWSNKIEFCFAAPSLLIFFKRQLFLLSNISKVFQNFKVVEENRNFFTPLCFEMEVSEGFASFYIIF